MTLMEGIRADREAGTPGPWRIGNHDPKRGIWVGGSNENGGAVLPYLWFGHTINFPNEYEANARRIARVPELEAIALAADELEEALAAYVLAERAAADTSSPDDYDFVFECWERVEAARAALAETGGRDE